MARIKGINSFTEKADHEFDSYTSLGYDYHGNLLRKVVSQEMFGNPLNDIPFRQIELLFEHLIDAVKQIKLQYAVALPKNSKLLN